MRRKLVVIGLGALVALGCSEKLVVDDTKTNVTSTTGGSENGAGGAPDAETAADLEGEWVGTWGSEVFVTSPKTLHLVLDANHNGTLLVGDTALAPPTDPSVGYPPEAEADAAVASMMIVHLYDGVTYTLQNVSVAGNALHFEVDAIAAFEPWCALQTPVYWSVTSNYRCLENWGGGVDTSTGEKQCYMTNPDTGARVDVDCLALYLCSVSMQTGCYCTASTCSAQNVSDQSFVVSFDLDLNESGTALTGTQSYWQEETHLQALELTRQ